MLTNVWRIVEDTKIEELSFYTNKAILLHSGEDDSGDTTRIGEIGGDQKHLDLRRNMMKEPSYAVKHQDDGDNFGEVQLETETQIGENENCTRCTKCTAAFEWMIKDYVCVSYNFLISIFNWIIQIVCGVVQNKPFRKILMMILALTVELFLMLVFSVSTVLAAIIINVDESLRKNSPDYKYEVSAKTDFRREVYTEKYLQCRDLPLLKSGPSSICSRSSLPCDCSTELSVPESYQVNKASPITFSGSSCEIGSCLCQSSLNSEQLKEVNR